MFPLRPGMGWYIPSGCLHSFFTEEAALDVVAWHPDSDFGPRSDDHPVINQTGDTAELIVSSTTHDARIRYSATKMRG
ncbi:MAG: hypothetical protein R3F40_00810 [Candidatus Competibacteraceae bacterium]